LNDYQNKDTLRTADSEISNNDFLKLYFSFISNFVYVYGLSL